MLKVAAAGVLLAALALAWHFTPLEQMAEPEAVRATLASFAQNPWAPLLMIATFVAAGLVAFPVTILIAATAAAFGPWPGLAYATAGVLVSAMVTYAVGARLGKEALRNVLGPRLNRIRRRIARRGVIAVATIRLVPLAPFTVVNLVAGASAIRPMRLPRRDRARHVAGPGRAVDARPPGHAHPEQSDAGPRWRCWRPRWRRGSPCRSACRLLVTKLGSERT